MEVHRTRNAKRVPVSSTTHEDLDRLLRDSLVAARVLSHDQLAEAVELSETLVALGEPHALGDLLILFGYAPPELVLQHAPPGYRLVHLASESDPSAKDRLLHGLRFLQRFR